MGDKTAVEARIDALLRNRRLIDAPTPGARFIRSGTGQRLLAGVPTISGTESVNVTGSAVETIALLRDAASAATMLPAEFPDIERQVQVLPQPTSLLPFCTMIPGTSPFVPVVPEQGVLGVADFADDGQPLPSANSEPTWSVELFEAGRVGRVIRVPLESLQDAGQAEATINRLLTQDFREALERKVIDGNDFHVVSNRPALIGVKNTSGVAFVNASLVSVVTALTSAVAEIQAMGYYGPHIVTASPETLRRILGETLDSTGNSMRWRELLPTVAGWIPTRRLEDGTAVVGQFSEVQVFLTGSFTVELRQVDDDVSRGTVHIGGWQRIAVWVRGAGAFQVIEDIAA